MTANGDLAEFVGLVDPDGAQFLRTVRVLADRLRSNQQNAPGLLVRAIGELRKGAPLSLRECDRRIAILVKSAELSDPGIRSLLELIAAELPSASNAVMAAIPAARRMGLIERRSRPVDSGTSSIRDGADTLVGVKPLPFRPVQPSDQTLRAPESDTDFRSVVLLGSEEEHERNSALLHEQGFTALRCESVDDLQQMAPGICGIVVGGRWWANISTDQHRTELCRVLEVSSMLFLRLGVDCLSNNVAREIANLQRDLYGSERDSATFCHAHGCLVTPADLVELGRVASLMKAAERTRFQPHGITVNEGVLLRALATKRVRSRHLDGGALAVQTLRAGLLSGGRSGAKIIIVTPDDGGPPLVAKLHAVERLRAELRKYQAWIKVWDDRVQPELVVHLDQAALVYRLVDSAHDPGRPAPTLEERLEKQRNSEIWDAMPTPSEHDAYTILDRTVGKLATLSKRRVEPNAPDTNEFWLDWSVKSLLKKGIEWELFDLAGNPINFRGLFGESLTLVMKLHGQAVVHGDANLRNVLANDDREPVLIDFEHSGPGHPCYDLVYFDGAVSIFSIRALCGEKEIAAMMRAIHFNGASYDEIERDFPKLVASIGNRIAIRTSIATRLASLDVLGQYGGTLSDYMAMRVVVNAFVMSRLSPQSVVVRAALSSAASPPALDTGEMALGPRLPS